MNGAASVAAPTATDAGTSQTGDSTAGTALKNYNESIFATKVWHADPKKKGKGKWVNSNPVPSWQVAAKGGPADGELFRVPGPPFEDITVYGVTYEAVPETLRNGEPKHVSHNKKQHLSWVYVPKED